MEKSLQVLAQIDSKQLYQQFIAQMNKDFDRAQCEIELTKSISPENLLIKTTALLHNLIQRQPSRLDQLLYLVDISEMHLSQIQFDDESLAPKQLCYLIIKREWQKVYFRSIHSSQQ